MALPSFLAMLNAPGPATAGVSREWPEEEVSGLQCVLRLHVPESSSSCAHVDVFEAVRTLILQSALTSPSSLGLFTCVPLSQLDVFFLLL